MQSNQRGISTTEIPKEHSERAHKGMWAIWCSLLSAILMLSTLQCVAQSYLPHVQCEMHFWQGKEFQARQHQSCKNGQRQESNQVCGRRPSPVLTCYISLLNVRALQSLHVVDNLSGVGMQGRGSCGKKARKDTPSERGSTPYTVRADDSGGESEAYWECGKAVWELITLTPQTHRPEASQSPVAKQSMGHAKARSSQTAEPSGLRGRTRRGDAKVARTLLRACLLYTSPSPRD